MSKKKEPLFSILCDSCAARLKVHNVSAIGQKLACPKCGEMVHVHAPEGWKPPPGLSLEKKPPENSSANQSSLDDMNRFAESGFDDIDQLLGGSTATQPPANKPTTNKASSSSSQKKAASTQRSAAGEPKTSGKERTGKKANAGDAKQVDERKPAQNKPAQTKSGLDTLTPDGKRSRSSARPASKPEAAPITDVDGEAGPLLPNQQWTSAAAKSRSKRFTMIAAIAGGALLLGALAVGVAMNMGDATVENDSPPNNAEAVEPPDKIPGTNPESTDASDPNVNNENAATPTQDDSALSSDETEKIKDPDESNATIDDSSDDPNEIDDSLSEPVVSDKPPEIPMPDTNPNSVDAQEEPKKTNAASLLLGPITRPNLNSETADAPAESTASAPELNAENLTRSLGDLTALLEQSGTSIHAISDLADNMRDREMVGLPKYYVDKPEAIEVDPIEALSNPCAGIRYQNAPLIVFIRDMQTLTGVPMALDLVALDSVDVSPVTEISVDETETTFGRAIDLAIAPLGFVRSLDPASGVILITRPKMDEPVLRPHQIPQVKEPSPKKFERFGQSIKYLIAPKVWTAEKDPATLTVNNDKVQVTATPNVHSQIDQFIEKLNVAERLVNEPNEDALLQALLPKHAFAAESLNRPTGMKDGISIKLEDALSKIYRFSGTTILIDWKNASPLGWNPNMKVPGSFVENSAIDAARELARSMKMTARIVDAQTIEITTFERSADLPEIEVYPIGKRVGGQLRGTDIEKLLRLSMGDSYQPAPVFEPEFECIIYYAPQTLQHQMDVVLKRLLEIGG